MSKLSEGGIIEWLQKKRNFCSAASLIDEKTGQNHLLLSENCVAMTISFKSIMLYWISTVRNISRATSKIVRPSTASLTGVMR